MLPSLRAAHLMRVGQVRQLWGLHSSHRGVHKASADLVLQEHLGRLLRHVLRQHTAQPGWRTCWAAQGESGGSWPGAGAARWSYCRCIVPPLLLAGQAALYDSPNQVNLAPCTSAHVMSICAEVCTCIPMLLVFLWRPHAIGMLPAVDKQPVLQQQTSGTKQEAPGKCQSDVCSNVRCTLYPC